MSRAARGTTRGGRVWRTLAPYLGTRRRLVLLSVCSIFAGFAEAALVLMIVQAAAAIAAGRSRIAEHVGPLHVDALTLPTLLVLAAGILLALIVLAYVNALIAARMTVTAVERARNSMVEAFVQASWRLQSQEREGRLQELLSTHAERVGQGVVTLTTGLTALLSFTALVASAFVVRPVAALSILLAVVLVYVLLLPLTRLTRVRSRRQAHLASEFALGVTELVNTAREIRVFGAGDEVETTLAGRAAAAARTGVMLRLLAKLTPSLYQYATLGIVLGGMAIVYSLRSSSVGDLGAVVLFLVRGLTYSQQVNQALHQAGELAPYLEELEQQLDTYRSDHIEAGGASLHTVDAIAFDEVTFSYDAGVPVLSGVSFEVEAGQVVGIIGPSGGGKSTLVQILLRLRRPDTGEYRINGIPAVDFRLADWCEQFAFVPQDNRLIRGTVEDNIRFHRPGLGPADVERAAGSAFLHDDVMRWPERYATVLGSGAMDLSGGQRQRLGLARALVGSPGVLILDEPTSALDMQSEALVQETLVGLKGDLTLFIVAHRMSTLAICDRIMVLDHGRLEAFGTPDEVRNASPFFAEATRLARLPV